MSSSDKNQTILYDRFKEGDLEVGVCPDCNRYYKQTFNPRFFCLPCLRKQSKHYRRDRHLMSRNLESKSRGQIQGKAEAMEQRDRTLRDLRARVSMPQPELSHRVKIIGRSQTHVRNCLKCEKIIRSESKFVRMCFECRHYAGTQGMQNSIHYI